LPFLAIDELVDVDLQPDLARIGLGGKGAARLPPHEDEDRLLAGRGERRQHLDLVGRVESNPVPVGWIELQLERGELVGIEDLRPYLPLSGRGQQRGSGEGKENG
jgi:hypothetical protein